VRGEFDLAVLGCAGKDSGAGEEALGGEIVAAAGAVDEGQSDRLAGPQVDRPGCEIEAPHINGLGGGLGGSGGRGGNWQGGGGRGGNWHGGGGWHRGNDWHGGHGGHGDHGHHGWHGHGGSSIYFGYGPWWGWGYPYYYPYDYGYGYGYGYPYYYPAPGYAYPPSYPSDEDQVYVEPPAAGSDQRAEGYWYYCESKRGYYPKVETCPEDWIKVPPQ
jgi:hypothetical protein